MKGKSKRLQMRHEVSDHGKIDRVVQKSFTKEASHKIETSKWGDGFISSIMKAISKVLGFFGYRKQIEHRGTSTKSYCKRFGGASGGTVKRSLGLHRGQVGNKLKKKMLSKGSLT